MFSEKTRFKTAGRKRLDAVLASLVAATGLSVMTGCGERTSAANLNEVAIEVAPAATPGASAVYDGAGSVTARHVYTLSFEIPGRVASVNFDVGDRVTKGSVLAQLDQSNYAAQAAAADAQAMGARATALKAERGARTQERASADAAVAAAQGQLDRAIAAASLATANAARARALFATGAISAQQADAAIAAQGDAAGAVDAARAQLAAARDQASLVAAGAREEDQMAARAQADAAEAGAQLASITLAKTILAAPADAIVEKRDIEVGDQAQPGAPAFVLEDASTPDVTLSVPERYAPQLHVGDPAVVTLGLRTTRATIYLIEPAADPASRTLMVRVRSQRLAMPLGAVVDVALGVAKSSGAEVPLGAVISDLSNDHKQVEIYDAVRHTVTLKPVRIIAALGDRVVIQGVTAGDPVVVAGQYEAKPGSPVHVVDGATTP